MAFPEDFDLKEVDTFSRIENGLYFTYSVSTFINKLDPKNKSITVLSFTGPNNQILSSQLVINSSFSQITNAVNSILVGPTNNPEVIQLAIILTNTISNVWNTINNKSEY